MPKLIAKIEIENDEVGKIKELGTLIQHVVKSVDHNDMIKLLTKVKANPKLVKTALKFV